MKRQVGTAAAVALALACLLVSRGSRAQDLEPRAYAPVPKDANFFLASYSYQSGDVLFDPSLPFSNVRAFINAATAGYGHTFSLFGRISSLAIGVPYVWASVDGNVGETYQAITRSGLGDPRLRFVVNLLGGPALPMREFMARKPEPTLGFSLVTVVPTGQYSSEELVNIGTNRWAFRPEFGLSFPVGRWTLEGAAGVWLFMDNTATYPGSVVRSQDPLYSFQAHVGYTVRPGLWVAADATYYAGGKTYADGVPGDTRQANSRAGVTASVPLGKGHTVKVSASRGVDARIGSRFDTIGFAYQYLWLTK
ncbi:MAG TPA: transporter [Thermoanaerobaculia bacterium]|nr:transporter [Thermoanaerobaculia bacterium]